MGDRKMTESDKKKAAKAFSEYWKDRGDEKSDSQSFWLALIRDILGVAESEKFIFFEERVQLDHTKFIDGYIPSTHVLIEQKKRGVNLRSPIRQSDGQLLNPFQQAQRYSAALPYSQRPRWIITCNFEEFLIYDMEKPTGEPESILLKDLAKEYYRFQFLVEEKSELLHREEKISIQAGELVGKLYDAILKQYVDPSDPKTLHSLNILCVRLVFCLYAEDAGIFGEHLKFHNYIKKIADKDVDDVREALIKLFRVLDQPISKRDPYLKSDLASFPYVNGGLFADENIEIPNFTQEIVDLLLHKASEDFDWSQISPTIFGAVFESTLNPETRRSGGMHYTSIENIHKVIDPLFLDELREEFEEIKAIKVPKTQKERAEKFRDKLASLTFLDPACGSGNFLTETYIALRILENKALKLIMGNQIAWDLFDNAIKVSIGQFYGIEINDFAVTVAKTALWIAESQMMKATEEILNRNLDFLPLKSYANIVEGNALRIDWETVVPKDKLDYIMGNPPFVGYKFQSKDQKMDIECIAGKFENYGTLDYVSCWYIKAAKFMAGTNVEAAFVSTNSVCQGEHVATLWRPLFNMGLSIDFARRTFRWDSEANSKAHVHCVIVGFSLSNCRDTKFIFDEDRYLMVSQINGYLLDAPYIFVEKRSKPWETDTPVATKGNAAMDNGNLTLTAQERQEILLVEPELDSLIRRHMSADDFLNNQENYCFWLKDVSPKVYSNSSVVMRKLRLVKEYRENSNRSATKKMADYPMLFAEIRQPTSTYLMLPVVSSEKRKYMPIAYLSPDIINSYASISIPNASLYHFGVLMSNVHNAWMRAVCGRLEMRYRYATSLVYNTFPWPNPTAEQKKKIEETAQAILDARALYPDCSLADLYDEVAMPPELRKAHQANDKAVMQAYGFWGKLNTESACVAELMKMYQKLVGG